MCSKSYLCRRFDSEASLELASTFPRLQEVRTMQMDGKDVVVIDVETYSHIMEELAMLKMKLSQLTDFLQVLTTFCDVAVGFLYDMPITIKLKLFEGFCFVCNICMRLILKGKNVTIICKPGFLQIVGQK